MTYPTAETRARSMPWGRSLAVSLLLVVATVAAQALQPTRPVVLSPPAKSLEALLPARLDGWEPARSVQLITADREDEVSRAAYSEVADRAYEDKDGNIIMLLFAYGGTETEHLQLHLPEVCYPAQGFTISQPVTQDLTWRADRPPVGMKRLVAKREWRTEYVSYWMRVGDYLTTGTMDRHLVSLRYGLAGAIPDGLLVRVSSIPADPSRGFAIQDEFMTKYLQSLSTSGDAFLLGRQAAAH